MQEKHIFFSLILTKTEILALKWSDIDFKNQVISVNRTLVYAKCDDESDSRYGKKINKFHDPKTEKGRRRIPMILRAYHIFKERKRQTMRLV